MSKPELPRIRSDLQIQQTEFQGQPIAIVRDTIGLIEKPVVLSYNELVFLSLLSKYSTVQDIQAAMMRMQGGVLISTDEIHGLIALLEEKYILDSGLYREAYNRLVKEYSGLAERLPVCSGSSYPADPGELTRLITSVIDSAGNDSVPGEVVALLTPHIDLTVGQTGYAKAYSTLKGTRPDRVILLGTGHSMTDAAFSVTRKNFRTPLGTVPTDRTVTDAILALDSTAVASTDIAHKAEHSLELQLVFLQTIFGEENFSIVPVLVGPFHNYLNTGRRASDIPGVKPVLDILLGELGDEGTNTRVIAGVDFSHVGPKFGDRQDAGEIIPESSKHDQALLDFIRAGDPEAFWNESRSVQDRYHVCGMSAIACMLEIIPTCKAKLLHYETWKEKSSRSAVSFASMVFYV